MIGCLLIEDHFESVTPAVVEVLVGFTQKLEVNPQTSIYIGLGSGTPWEITPICDQIIEKVAPLKIQVRLGVASVRFVSFVAAKQAGVGEYLLIPPDHTLTFLSDQRISLLPIRPETQRRLELLGLRTLGKIANMPSAYLVYQFGKEGRLMAELARGIDPTPLLYYRAAMPADPVSHQLDFFQANQNGAAYSSVPTPVRRDERGYPQALHINSWLTIVEIVDHWRTEDRWWTQHPMDQHYFEVALQTGQTLTLFENLQTGSWYRLAIPS